MSHVQPVPMTANVKMSVAAEVRHLCPFVNEADNGTVTVTWRTNGATFELHSLREYLNGFKDSEISHEMLTDRIRHDLSVTQGVEVVAVESTWDTAGMEVQCSTSPTPAEVTS